MATLFVRHSVVEFGAWMKAYDDFDEERASMGVTGHGVYSENCLKSPIRNHQLSIRLTGDAKRGTKVGAFSFPIVIGNGGPVSHRRVYLNDRCENKITDKQRAIGIDGHSHGSPDFIAASHIVSRKHGTIAVFR